MELKNDLKQATNQIEMQLQAAIFHIRAEIERNDSKALPNFVSCRAVLHNRVTEVFRTLPGADSPAIDFEA